MRVVEAFREAYGDHPAGVWHAPGRVNLIGEHTDYNDGLVLPFAVPWGITAAVRPRDDGTVRIASLQAPGEDQVLGDLDLARGWARYAAGVFWALREEGHDVRGADILIDGDLPRGAGLASSAALEVVTALALSDLYGLGLEPMELARIGRRAENEFAGVPCGIMDQAVSALAREDHALFLDCRSLASRPVPFRPAEHGLRLLIIDTRVRHALGDGRYAERRQECANAAKRLGVPALRDVTDLASALQRLSGAERARTQHVVTEIHRVQAAVGLMRAGALDQLGSLLISSHLSLRDQFQVSCPELDVAVEAAVGGGARGARMTGAGFGGSVLALVPEGRLEDVEAAVREAYAARGWAEPGFLRAAPAAGARRIA
ncbi:galactokinase [Thermobispora bispora]|uniref:galactokinase n=1 Tax=Thermobispora bispora TaxID=2006 RepID=UPI001981E472|nr:galactokinase [Thermobispora bispora]MBO2473797.1 galactokinase [Actinomycetales bacterium]MBX6358067.1 galactokinase [Micromonosporaceae bacterium]MDI9579541.1 galactokinase [Thermobispora sp.]QSI47791.1 galactokinase [Thermobispora bispora]